MRLSMILKISVFIVVLFVIGFIIVKNVRAQVHVSNPAFDVTLSTLLSHSVPEVSAAEIENSANCILLDARSEREYAVSHIKGAIWVGYDDFNLSRIADIAIDSRIIVYCSVGYRSEKIAEQIRQAGYTDVSNLYGGIFEWVNTKHPVVTGDNTPTDSVHAFDKKWGVWLQYGHKVYD